MAEHKTKVAKYPETLEGIVKLINELPAGRWLKEYPDPVLVEMDSYRLDMISEKSFQTTRVDPAYLRGLVGAKGKKKKSFSSRVLPLSPTKNSKKRGMISIGRDLDNDLVLDFPLISKIHAYFRYDSGKRVGFMQDGGSTNSTFINGKKLSENEWVALRDNDIIDFSGKYFYVYYSPAGLLEMFLISAEKE